MTEDHELPRPDLPRPAPVLPSELSASIYASLHELATRQLRDQRQNSLQPTSLVHEAWLRIAKLRELRGEQRAQFFALAGKAMRSVVVDHARRRLAHKRDGGRSSGVDPDATSAAAGPAANELLALDEALQRLEAADPESVRVVDLLFFAGKTAAEAAELLGTSSRTVERRWRFARAWLRDCLGGDDAGAGGRDDGEVPTG
jgi:RNA polymerase sigma factor (TIGR02999 family)